RRYLERVESRYSKGWKPTGTFRSSDGIPILLLQNEGDFDKDAEFKRAIIPLLFTVLQREWHHIKQPGCVVQGLDVLHSRSCGEVLLLCRGCGRLTLHFSCLPFRDFVPASKFSPERLEWHLNAVGIMSKELASAQINFHEEVTDFTESCNTGRPCHIEGLGRVEAIGPDHFIQNYAGQKCNIVDCDTGEKFQDCVESFFTRFQTYGVGSQKLTEWPHSDEVLPSHRQLLDAFEQIWPFGSYTSNRGSRNLASNFPLNYSSPDLGPKIYAATKSGKYGATRLHIDAADTVNVMMYAAEMPPSTSCAIWHIFQPHDTGRLGQYLREAHPASHGNSAPFLSPLAGLKAPILCDQYFLTPSDITSLALRGIHPTVIRQKVGDAVFVPCGSPYQVENCSACMGFSVNFISPTGMKAGLDLCDDYRMLNTTPILGKYQKWVEDIVKFEYLLWFAWMRIVHSERAHLAGGVVA
ncbi:hypothetical protein BD410DRAFT_810640, partial [Rickenella mellea]